MAKKEAGRLEFQAGKPENEQKIGASKQINPLSLIPETSLPANSAKTQDQHHFEGTFVDDYLLAEDGNIKGKRIAKNDKRTHFKTKMCPHGRDCRRRLTCTFAHTQNERRKPFMKRKTVCKQYQMGKCHLGSACREYHGNIDLMKKNYKYKTELCKDFLEGKCLMGNVCIYIHEKPGETGSVEQEEIGEQMEEIKQQEAVNPNITTQEEKEEKKIEQKPEAIHQGKKEIIEIIEEKIGEQQFVQNGFTFSFNFS